MGRFASAAQGDAVQYEDMLRRSRSLDTAFRWLWSTAAVLATVAQLVVAAAPLVEARNGRSADAHMEAGGVTAHYAHNEAACAACQARSIMGTTARRAFAMPVPLRAQVAATHLVGHAVRANVYSRWNPRAPPSVI